MLSKEQEKTQKAKDIKLSLNNKESNVKIISFKQNSGLNEYENDENDTSDAWLREVDEKKLIKTQTNPLIKQIKQEKVVSFLDIKTLSEILCDFQTPIDFLRFSY